ncbi:MAG: tetratricopeptide repeat protein [Mariprofundaceae bacterium]|nr:tetratricopeptide repeat protein [Mariprofundaceae bacterium]
MKVLGSIFYILILLFVWSWQVQAESVNDQAKKDLSLGRVAVAEDLLNKQVQSEPNDYQAWFLLGVAQARTKHFHQAIEAFRQVIELRNDLAEPHNNLAVIYNELGDVKAAVSELEQSLQKHPGYAIAEENIANLYIKLALQYYKKALVKNDNPALTQRYARLLQVRDNRRHVKESVPHDVAQAEKLKKPVQVVLKKREVLAEKVVPNTLSVENRVEDVIKATPSTLPEQADMVKADNHAVVANMNESTGVKEVLADLEAWRLAWQSQDLEAYFSAYANDYVPTGKYASLATWKAYKKRVIGNKSYIKVDLSDVKVDFSEDKNVVQIRFNQAFRSNNYNGDDVKLLKLEKRQQGWKIVREASIS